MATQAIDYVGMGKKISGVDPAVLSAVMSELGKRGGPKGGKAAAEKMTPEERTARAKKAAAKSAEVRQKKAKKK
jgi:hypothetical protein